MISAFYYARTWTSRTCNEGPGVHHSLLHGQRELALKMRYMGKETIKLRNGKYRCLKFQPVVQEGPHLQGNDDLNVWITDDGNHIPVLAQAKVLVGSIKMELSGYEGLRTHRGVPPVMAGLSTRDLLKNCPHVRYAPAALFLAAHGKENGMDGGGTAIGRGVALRGFTSRGLRPHEEYVPDEQAVVDTVPGAQRVRHPAGGFVLETNEVRPGSTFGDLLSPMASERGCGGPW
jgi:hypothetical protein